MRLPVVDSNEPISTQDTIQEIDLCDRCEGHGQVRRSQTRTIGRMTEINEPVIERCEQCRGAGRIVRTLTFSYVDNTLP